jgi:class 3 adenylate cyclase
VNGEDAMVTVLFIDMRDFTRFADSATARQAVMLLNKFVGVVVPVLESHARVEQATRRTGDAVLVTESTRCMLTRAYGLVPRGTLALKGKTASVAVYAPAAPL